VGADRVVGRDRGSELLLVGERQLRDLCEAAALEAGELLTVERRAFEEVGELGTIALVVRS
jgi:hypothetical protein